MSRKAPRPDLSPIQALEERSVPATLSGTVFADTNGNTVRDAGEVGLAGVTVQVDQLSDGKVDGTFTTDTSGNYTFTGLANGVHTVIVVPPSSTTPLGPTSRIVNTSDGKDQGGVSIGLRPNGKVGGTVFSDLNGSGFQDPGEAGLSGVSVNLDLLGDGTVEFAATTGADGTYLFQNVPDGAHKLTVNPPLNHTATVTNPQTVTLANGISVTGANAGMRPQTGLSGRVYLGTATTGNPGLAGTTVSLDAFSDGTVDQTTVTDSTGGYSFANVPVGSHTVSVAAPPGATFTTPAGSNKITTNVTTGVQGGINFGVSLSGGVGGSLFVDQNNNGVKDAGERNLPPGRVQVDLGGTGKLMDVTPTLLSDGTFKLAGLPDGSHALVVTPPSGYAAAAPVKVPFTVAGGGSATLASVPVRMTPGSTLVIGNGAASGAKSYTFTPNADGTLTPAAGRAVTPPSAGGSRAVAGDFNGDGTDDIITATSAGETGVVRVYDGKTGAELTPSGGVQVFEGTFKGGLNLAAGDINGDGKADIVAAADTGGGPRVKVLDAAQFQAGADLAKSKYLADFFGIEDTKFRGGARVAVGDLNGDGTPDVVVAAGIGGGPRIAIWDGTSMKAGTAPTHLAGDFFAFEPALRNGTTVAVGDFNGDGKADLAVGAGPGGASRVTVFSGAGLLENQGSESPRVADFFVANNTASRSGTRVAVKDVDADGKADLVASDAARTYVYTSKGLTAYYLNPGTTGPAAQAELVPFAGAEKSGVFLG